MDNELVVAAPRNIFRNEKTALFAIAEGADYLEWT